MCDKQNWVVHVQNARLNPVLPVNTQNWVVHLLMAKPSAEPCIGRPCELKQTQY